METFRTTHIHFPLHVDRSLKNVLGIRDGSGDVLLERVGSADMDEWDRGMMQWIVDRLNIENE